MDETLADEFKRLVQAYEFGGTGPDAPKTQEEAWNLIADFAYANYTVIYKLLSLPMPTL